MADLVAAPDHIPVFRLDALGAGILSAEEAQSVHAHLDRCLECAARFRELEAERAAFLVGAPPEAAAAKLLATQRPRWRPRFLPAAIFAATAAAAVAAVLLLRPPGTDDHILFKGEPSVIFDVRETPGAVIRAGQSGEAYPPGAVLQLKVVSPEKRKVSTYVMDAQGALTRLLDFEVEGSGALPSSLVLDDAPGAERIIVIFAAADQPVPEESVRKAAAAAFARAGGAVEAVLELDLDQKGVVVRTILIRKRR